MSGLTLTQVIAVDCWVVENGVGSLSRIVNMARTMNINPEVAEVLDSIQAMANDLRAAMTKPER